MLWLTTVNLTFYKGNLKKCLDLGWKGVVGRRYRKRLAYLWKNPGYAPAKARKKKKQESWETSLSSARGPTLKEALIKNHSWRNETSRSFQRKKRVTTVVSGRSVKSNAIFAVCDLSALVFKTLRCCSYVLPYGYLTFPIYGNTMLRYEQQTLTTLFWTVKSDFMDVKRFEF